MESKAQRWLPYDWFKLVVAILLILLLLVFWNRPVSPLPVAAPIGTSTPVVSPTLQPPSTTPVPLPRLTLDQPSPSDLLTEGAVTFAGLADPGLTVELSGNGSALGSTTASATGEWSITTDLTPGNLEVIARALDESGATLAETEPLTWQVESLAQPLQPPTIDSPSADQAPTAGPVEFSGTAPAGTTIELTDASQTLAETTASDTGEWSLIAELPAGDLTIIAQAIDISSGESAASAPLALHIDPAPSDTSTGNDNSGTGDSDTPGDSSLGNCGQGKIWRGTYIVAACENLTRISRILGITLEELLAANPQIENPDLIFPNQILNIPVSDDEDD
ncbi:MAG: LysM peptidoglycan-binding domain-containing protein [Anaerolineae bacterium]|nr:MAG: LysM peptidoglycan-binding domain-containing protein [Anaerolineae bacterium]